MMTPPLPPDDQPDAPDPDDVALPEALAAALRDEALYPMPSGLEHRILRALPRRPAVAQPVVASPWRTLARVAAAMLVAVGSWFAFSGEAPAFASAWEAPGLLARARDVAPTDVLPREIATRTAPAVAAARDHAPAMLTLVIGVILLAGGLALLLHWHRQAAQGDST